MHLNWEKAKQKFQYLVAQNGTWVQWLSGSTDRTNSYNTSNTDTYGYGDAQRSWVTGSIKVIISHISATDLLLEVGFTQEDYDKIWIDPDINIQIWDQFLYPTGSSPVRYICRAIHDWTENGIVVSRHVDVRRLIPKSKDVY